MTSVEKSLLTLLVIGIAGAVFYAERDKLNRLWSNSQVTTATQAQKSAPAESVKIQSRLSAEVSARPTPVIRAVGYFLLIYQSQGAEKYVVAFFEGNEKKLLHDCNELDVIDIDIGKKVQVVQLDLQDKVHDVETYAGCK